jgi:hypothetical protein
VEGSGTIIASALTDFLVKIVERRNLRLYHFYHSDTEMQDQFALRVQCFFFCTRSQ